MIMDRTYAQLSHEYISSIYQQNVFSQFDKELIEKIGQQSIVRIYAQGESNIFITLKSYNSYQLKGDVLYHIVVGRTIKIVT